MGAPFPNPVLTRVINHTPYPHKNFHLMAKGVRFCDVFTLTASYALANGPLKAAAQQRGLHLIDEYADANDPVRSALVAAQEDVVYKPEADVYVTGHVRSPGGLAATQWDGMLRVARPGRAATGKTSNASTTLIQKTLRFTGPRAWQKSKLGGWTLAKPEPCTEVALNYALAYGGYRFRFEAKLHDAKARTLLDDDESYDYCEGNPSGSGYFGPSFDVNALRRGERVARPGPQITTAGHDVTVAGERRTPPAGWSPIARFWQPRVALQGTYDAAWRKAADAAAIPDYPADFDDHYFQYAPPDQRVKGYLRGDELIELAGVFATQDALSAALPGTWMEVELVGHDRAQVLHTHMNLDTVHVDLDAMALHCTWRLSIDHSHGAHTLAVRERALVDAASSTANASTATLPVTTPATLYAPGPRAQWPYQQPNEPISL